MRDYREKAVKGCIVDSSKPFMMPRMCEVTVRMTRDEKGESLSLQAFNVMVEIPLESVKDIVRVSEVER